MVEKKRFVFAERQRALQIAATCGLSVIEEQGVLHGYQIYIVEQWVCDRKIPTNVVKVFTGDESHTIQVSVIAIPVTELQSPRPEIQSLLNLDAHLKFKSTQKGDILLTDPSKLPYDTDIVLIPDGDYDKWIKQAYVNINLRRTNCTGRSSLNLRPPNSASEEKFRSIYKIADSAIFDDAVIGLVSLVQIALYLFKLLNRDYIDGLICNQTTAALGTFYEKYSPVNKNTEFTLKEPWMEPHLVASIISKLLLCRSKLQDHNFTTIKDPFIDYDGFRIDIGDYQKYKGIKMTRYIDLDTLAKLNDPSYAQLKVRKVLKSKLDDISGSTNSSLLVEVSDPEMFRHHATIDSLRMIWRPKVRGKSQKSSSGTMLGRVAGSIPWINTSMDSSSGGRRSGYSSHSPSIMIGSSPNSTESLTKLNTMSPPHNSKFSMVPDSTISENEVYQQHQPQTSTTPATSVASSSSRISIGSNNRKPSPLSGQTSGSMSAEEGEEDDEDDDHFDGYDNLNNVENGSNNSSSNREQDKRGNTKRKGRKYSISVRHLDQDIPSYARNSPGSPNYNRSESSPAQSLPQNQYESTMKEMIDHGDFVPLIDDNNSQKKRPSIRHARSISDSVLVLDPTISEPVTTTTSHLQKQHHHYHHQSKYNSNNNIYNNFNLNNQYNSHNINNNNNNNTTTTTTTSTITTSNTTLNNNNVNILKTHSRPIFKLHDDDDDDAGIDDDNASSSSSYAKQKRSNSISVLDETHHIPPIRPIVSVDVQTYLVYERLRHQQNALKSTLEEVKKMADEYESTANDLKQTYDRRFKEFEEIQHESRSVMDEQHITERRLKEVEENSAKLQYELVVMNDKLKDIEDNVGSFYGKVGSLERRMDDSQQSATTMNILVKYFNHYWVKVAVWVQAWRSNQQWADKKEEEDKEKDGREREDTIIANK